MYSPSAAQPDAAHGLRRVFGAVRSALRAHPLAADTLLAVAVTAAVLTSIWLDSGPLRDALNTLGSRIPEPRAVWYASGLAMCLPLALRRRWPLSVLVVSGVAFSVFRLTDAPEGTFSAVALFLSVYSAGVYGRPAGRTGCAVWPWSARPR